MFNLRIQQNNKDTLTLFKGKNGYDKITRSMNEAPKVYEAIKLLVEENNNITNIQQNNINKKSKNNINLKSHNKIRK